MVWKPGKASRALLGSLIRAGGQEATLGRVTWSVAANETEESATVLDRQVEVPVHLEKNTGGREQQTTGVKVEGEWTLVAQGGVVLAKEMYVKMTKGPHTGTYLRVVGRPEKAMGHHWEAECEEVDAGQRVRDEDVLA